MTIEYTPAASATEGPKLTIEAANDAERAILLYLHKAVMEEGKFLTVLTQAQAERVGELLTGIQVS